MQEYKDWDGNLLLDPAPRIHNVHIGTISETREYEVIAVYPHMVQTRDCKTGFTRCFSYGELTTMGLQWQGKEMPK